MSNSRLAPDLEPILLALREKGLRTLEDYASVEEYREVYEQVCQATALKPDSEVLINTLTCQTTNGLIRLRHYSPKDLKTKKSQPCTIFIHGGGWVLGNLEAYDGVCEYLTALSQQHFISIEYRLAPEVNLDAIIKDCEEAITYVLNEAAHLGIDKEKISLMGDSAGGYLVGYLSHVFTSKFKEKLHRLVMFYPVVNLEEKYASYCEFDEGFPLSGEVMRWFLKQVTTKPLAYDVDHYSLLNLTLDSQVDTFLVTVGHDPLRDEGLALAQHLVHQKVNLEHHHLAGHMHTAFTLYGVLPSIQKLLTRVGIFLNS